MGGPTRRRSRPTLAVTIDWKLADGVARGRQLSARVVMPIVTEGTDALA
jgi:hypothetical protein